MNNDLKENSSIVDFNSEIDILNTIKINQNSDLSKNDNKFENPIIEKQNKKIESEEVKSGAELNSILPQREQNIDNVENNDNYMTILSHDLDNKLLTLEEVILF
jgi:hypothetical protein